MVLRRSAPVLLVLAACAGLQGTSRLESSVVLAPAGKCTLRVSGADRGDVAIDMHGVGAGAVTFDVNTGTGEQLAHGVLTAESKASAFSESGEVVVTFAAGGEGGTVVYVVHSRTGGVAVTSRQ